MNMKSLFYLKLETTKGRKATTTETSFKSYKFINIEGIY